MRPSAISRRRTPVVQLLVLTSLLGLTQCRTRPDEPTPAVPPVVVVPPPPSIFAVIGDYGYAGANEEAVATRVNSWRPAYIVTTGDNNYDNGATATIERNIGAYYHRYIGGYAGPAGPDTTRANHFFPSLGNHDLYTPGGQPYLAYFSLPGNERYYQVRQRAVEWFILNSNPSEPDGTSPTSRQGLWLQQALAASTAPWKLVVFHHPPYSSGDHGSTTGMRWPFKAWGAHAVLSGHDHDYERLVIDGLPYVVNGLGGRSLYAFGTTVPGSVVRYNTAYGALKGRADSVRLALTFITAGGQAIDSLVLTH